MDNELKEYLRAMEERIAAVIRGARAKAQFVRLNPPGCTCPPNQQVKRSCPVCVAMTPADWDAWFKQ
jgi:hypothetical protein